MSRLINLAAILVILVVFGTAAGCGTFESKHGQRVGDAQIGEQHFDERQVSSEIQKSSLLATKAALLEADGNDSDAMRIYEDLVKNDPRNVAALHRLAVLHVKLNQVEQAEKRFADALRHGADNAHLRNDYGYFCHLQGRTDLAQQHLTKAIELRPDLRSAQINLGLHFASLDRTKDAHHHFRLGGCTEAEALNNLAYVKLMQSDHQTATRLYQAALRQDPSQTVSRNSLDTLSRVSNRR